MSNDSTTGGPLIPETIFADAPAPLYDSALEEFFQPIIAGMTGITGSLVLPRWQPVMANKPANTVNWCAFAVTVNDAPAHSFVGHQSFLYDQNNQPEYDDNLHTYDETPVQAQRDVLQVQEEIEVSCSFYGPNSRGNAAQLRDGFQIAQNREVLQLNNIAFVSTGAIRPLPELINNLWHQRSDVILYLRRAVVRTYPVFDLLSAQGTVLSDDPPVSRTFTDSSS